jgi:hypothetical protein
MSLNKNDQIIQRDYARYYSGPLVGSQPKRDYEAPNPTQIKTASSDMSPGDGVFIDVNGQWAKPTLDVDTNLVTNILAFDPTSQSVAIPTPTTNQSRQILYFTGNQPVPGFVEGVTVVLLGETVKESDRLAYQQSTSNFVLESSLVPAGPMKLTIISLKDALSGNSVLVRFRIRN